MQYEGDGSFGFVAVVDGDDLVITDVRATWFGGDSDPNDSGDTASGISTKNNPDILGCSLPMSTIEPRACAGSPFRKLKWKTEIHVFNAVTNQVVTCQLIDVGPAKRKDGAKQGAIDLTPAAMKAIWNGVMHDEATVNFRIIGGALQATDWA